VAVGDTLKEFESLVGLKYRKLIHLNDCRDELFSHRDRRESIGLEKIGKKGLTHFEK
jgi:endonuclease IV